MYLCHYVNNQNGPTLLRRGEGGASWSFKPQNRKKKNIKNRNKNSLKAENRIQNHQNRFFTS